MTGRPLLPAAPSYEGHGHGGALPQYSMLIWTFGRGSVIWRIWPAVFLHTLFAGGVVTLSMKDILRLEIPNIMLTVLGVVIGFVISYRAMSGYERYWLGRTCWSDVIKNSRAMSRFIWFHVPSRTSAKTPEETASGKLVRSRQELEKVMAEKRMALDLVEGFAVALKHHIRGETGIYYEDLYHLIQPMHEHSHTADDSHGLSSAVALSPRKPQRITSKSQISTAEPPATQSLLATAGLPSPLTETESPMAMHATIDIPAIRPDFLDADPFIPPINAYGTFNPSLLTPSSRLRRTASGQSSISAESAHQPLLPSQVPQDYRRRSKVSGDLVPFAEIFTNISTWFRRPETIPSNSAEATGQRTSQKRAGISSKYRPQILVKGENLPLEILRCLSEWFSVLEDRGVVPGTSMGQMLGLIAAFEDNLTALERILTTPLPFVYAVHIRHTVWLYLFFLPFQLVSQFGYFTIPGVAMAAFIYLGFVAAGEEIEQPFGYDDNDLDLDLFCQVVIHTDVQRLKTTPCLNAWFPPEASSSEHPAHMGTKYLKRGVTVSEDLHQVKVNGHTLDATLVET